MATHETVLSSAEHTDLDESFEDASDLKDGSVLTSPNMSSRPSTPDTPLNTSENDPSLTKDSIAEIEEPEDSIVVNGEPNGSEKPDPITVEQHPAHAEDTTAILHESDAVLPETAATVEEEHHADQDNLPELAAHELPQGAVHNVPAPAARDDASTRSVKSLAASEDQVESTATDSSVISPKASARPSRFQGLSAALPTVPWGGAPRRPSNAQPPSSHVTATARKGSTFGWLTRASSTPKDVKSPPPAGRSLIESRRNTGASIMTVSNNADLMLKALDESHDGANGTRLPAKASLREQFKMLRMRDEVALPSPEEQEKGEGGAISSGVGQITNAGLKVTSPEGVAEGQDGVLVAHSPIPVSPRTEAPPPATFSNDLAQGTVSGISASHSDAAMPIDWDFWQTVVNEGPQAVARTSPEELTQAIAGGIPQTIRGVIWQVLASSKNEDLESVYHDLRSRGTKDEIRESQSHASMPSISLSNASKEKDSVGSSKSSIHSDSSTPIISTNVGGAMFSPSQELADPISSAKLQAQLVAERAKKAKDEATSLAKLEKMIKRDMGSRTSYSKFAAASGFQDGLFNVCKAYALFDDVVGYPQGLNFIITPLLFTMPEDEAFCLLVRMMNKYQLRDLFVDDMPGLHLHLYQFERLLEDLEPTLYCHLNRRGVSPKLYATQWFLTLFAYRFPLQLVMRVFDLVLCEGLEGAILKFGMAVIQRNVTSLLAMNDMQTLTNFLKEKIFDVYIDSAPSSKSILESGFFGSSGGTDSEVYRADLLVQDACAIKLTPETLAKYREEWEDKTRTEKARETELENLRTDAVTKAAQIRSLEQRAEKSDAEQIEIANELVRLKLENTELNDHNESLRGQVGELRKVADSEAANVEERMRAGTEQVMQRNIEVQNENRNMEEQMAEMEKELIEMKMKYAELNGDHDTLKQKWSDLRRALE